jgi:hypothetical protein
METETETNTNEKTSAKMTKLHGVILTETKTNSSTNLESLDKFLEKEKIFNSNEPWSKLDKTTKFKKLVTYVEEYSLQNKLTEKEKTKLISFLKDSLDRKKLQRVKDVVYDKVSGIVKDIPALHYNKPTNHFTLKNIDKTRVSTLKSLPPKKSGTAKNITENSDDDDEDEE